MRFLPHGPDIPDELITAQEKGQIIFVCGAGVSCAAGLPLFKGLVERVYEKLGEDWNLHPAEREGMRENGVLKGQYDRVLRSLERRLAASDTARNRSMRDRIRAAVRDVLTPPDDANLANHLALLKLSRDAEDRVRLLTTNFDTLFERAWFGDHRAPIESYAGLAMPQPKTARCTGVLHLHGRLGDSWPGLNNYLETDLVLTSAEFGDAYLRAGWASRYVYDLVRAYTVVLVGYQAEDPPMRYLLEALEADRERFPDLQKVYAFASCELGEEKLEGALWRAKAVEPILYSTNDDDHSSLYDSVREWQLYAEDPTAWRREQLRVVLNESPGSLPDARIQECAALLAHGDASQLLGELSPKAEWLPVLLEKRVFDREDTRPGDWIATRINDPDMIRACAGLAFFDEQTRWHINRAVERERPTLTSVRLKAWQLMLAGKRPRPASYPDDNWYLAARNVKKGEAGFEARRLVVKILQPRLEVAKAFRWGEEAATQDVLESLQQLLRLNFQSAEHPPPEDILAAWPKATDQELALFRSLDRSLRDAMEEAADAGFLDGFDRPATMCPRWPATPRTPTITASIQLQGRSPIFGIGLLAGIARVPAYWVWHG
jgi:SIR2-like domain